MIKLVPDPTFEQDVSIAVPGSDAGQVVKFTFRTLDRQRVLALLVIAGQAEAGWLKRMRTFIGMCLRVRAWVTAVELLDELVVKWEGINVDYSKNNLRLLLLEYPSAKESIFFAYFSGLREAKTKN